ncbi:MAG: hypothetical protein HC783_10700 [Rhodobacteraceae bacterium]|nr:hypothetical protein [Paracoccaceae bacterium]
MAFAFEYLVPLNLMLFALMFAGIFFYDRRVRYTGWLAAAYLSGVVASLLDIARPHSPVARWDESDFSYYFYWAMGMLVFVSMASRFSAALPARLMILLVAVGLGGQWIFGYVHYHHGWQEALNNGLLATWLVMAARVARRGSESRGHRLVAWLFLAIAASCVLRVVGIYIPGWVAGTDLVTLAKTHNIAQLFLSGASVSGDRDARPGADRFGRRPDSVQRTHLAGSGDCADRQTLCQPDRHDRPGRKTADRPYS